MTVPTKSDAFRGLFVYRRLSAMARYHPIRVLCPRPWFPGLRPAVADEQLKSSLIQIDVRNMFYFPVIGKAIDGRWMRRCIERWIRNEVSDLDGAVIDGHFGYPEGVACFLAAKKLDIPYFITVRGVEVDWLKKRNVKAQIIEALQNAAGIFSVSYYLRDILVEHGIPADRIVVIPNACDTDVFHPGDQDLARQELGVSSEPKQLVTVGSIKRGKGYDILIDACARLREPFELTCIGGVHESDFFDRLKNSIAKHQLNAKIRFSGSLPPETIASYLRAADLFVLTSRREGCCNAVLEAICCRTPIVATNVGDNARYVGGNRNIRIVPVNDVSATTKAINASLAGDPIESCESADGAPIPSWEWVAETTINEMQSCLC